MQNQIRINVQNIENETERALLIKLPNKSKYAGFKFWVSKKLIRRGSHSYEIVLFAGDNFEFEIKRYGKNRNILEEKKIGALELLGCFNG